MLPNMAQEWLTTLLDSHSGGAVESWLYQGKDTRPVISTSLNKFLLIKIM